MEPNIYDFFMEFVKQFNLASNFLFFLIGILCGFFLFLITDNFADYIVKYIARKREIKNGTAGKRKEEKDG